MAWDEGGPYIRGRCGGWASVFITVDGGSVVVVVCEGRTSSGLIRGLTRVVVGAGTPSGALGATRCAKKKTYIKVRRNKTNKLTSCTQIEFDLRTIQR